VEELDGHHGLKRRIRLQWGHGDEAVEEFHGLRLPDSDASLQWGHGDEAVEELNIKNELRAVARASMGPRR